MYKQNPIVLVADPIVLQNNDSKRSPKEIVEAMGGFFVEGPITPDMTFPPGKTVYSYQPNLKPAEIDAELGSMQYEGVIVAAKKVTNTNVKFAVRIGAGTNNLDDLKAAGVTVMNTPGFNSEPTANAIVYTLYHALTGGQYRDKIKNEATNPFIQNEDVLANAPQADSSDLKAYNHSETLAFEGEKPKGKKIAVIGVGHIGGLAAQMLARDGHEVVGYSPRFTNEKAEKIGIKRALSVLEAAKDADVIIVQTPLIDEPESERTRNIISEAVMRAAKRGVTIVNAGRTGLVDEKALEELAAEGRVSAVLVDVDFKHTPDGEKKAESPMSAYIRVWEAAKQAGQKLFTLFTPHTYADTHDPSRNFGAQAAVYMMENAIGKGIFYNHVNKAPDAEPSVLDATKPETLPLEWKQTHTGLNSARSNAAAGNSTGQTGGAASVG